MTSCRASGFSLATFNWSRTSYFYHALPFPWLVNSPMSLIKLCWASKLWQVFFCFNKRWVCSPGRSCQLNFSYCTLALKKKGPPISKAQAIQHPRWAPATCPFPFRGKRDFSLPFHWAQCFAECILHSQLQANGLKGFHCVAAAQPSLRSQMTTQALQKSPYLILLKPAEPKLGILEISLPAPVLSLSLF